MKCMIKVMGVYESPHLERLRKRLEKEVNGGGNHVHILPEAVDFNLVDSSIKSRGVSCEVWGCFSDRDVPVTKAKVRAILEELPGAGDPLVFIVEPR